MEEEIALLNRGGDGFRAFEDDDLREALGEQGIGAVFEIARPEADLGVVAAGQDAASGTLAAPPIQVILNWFEELKARVPAK